MQVKNLTDVKQAIASFQGVQERFSKWGAYDTEPCSVFRDVLRQATENRPFKLLPHDPVNGRNIWDLYDSVPGWEQANAALTAAAKRVYAVVRDGCAGPDSGKVVKYVEGYW